MRFGLLTIGDELLNGKVLDRNKLHIGRLVDSLGGQLHLQLSTPDDLERMEEAFHFAMKRCDILFMTGGLGGTHDDLSFALVERVFQGAQKEEIENQVGIASGWILKKEQKTLILLPGPPRENLPMIRQLHDQLQTEVIHERFYILVGIGEVLMETKLREHLGEERTKYFATYVADGYTTLRVRTKDRKLCEQICEEVETLFQKEIYATGDETIPLRLFSMLKDRGLTLALVESASCGGIASLLSEVSGVSEVLYGSYVVYSPQAKQQMLDIAPELLIDDCVGEEITRELARAARRKSGSSLALALTGYSEHPDPQKHGQVFVSMCSNEREECLHFRLRQNREANLVRMCYRALAFAIDFLLNEEE